MGSWLNNRWEIDTEPDEDGYHIRSVNKDGGGESIAWVYPSHLRSITLKNAKLLANAPELFKTLKHIHIRLGELINDSQRRIPKLITKEATSRTRKEIRKYRILQLHIEKVLIAVEARK